MSTQFLRIQKKNRRTRNQEKHSERYVKTISVFGFNSARYDLNLIKSYSTPYFICDNEIEPTVYKKANDFLSFKIQFLPTYSFST